MRDAAGSRLVVLDADETSRLPDRVCVPTRPGRDGGTEFELRTLVDGRTVLPVFSSITRIVSTLGGGQPWTMIPADRLASARRTARFHALLLDPSALATTARTVLNGRWDDPESPDWTLVYLPARRRRQADEPALVELQPVQADLLALFAYSSEDSIRRGCGGGQPWVTVPAGLLDDVRREARADTIVLDTPLPRQLRHEWKEHR